MARLLLVDDESNIRHLYSLMLSEEGYDVEAAASVSEAEQKLTYNNYDLILLDIKLKNENGLDLLQKIVRQRHDLPVVLCSAYSCYKDDFTSWLADGYVEKSSDPQELMGEIARVLAKKNRQ
jgi:DNA-binding NtrC family response regulator